MSSILIASVLASISFGLGIDRGSTPPLVSPTIIENSAVAGPPPDPELIEFSQPQNYDSLSPMPGYESDAGQRLNTPPCRSYASDPDSLSDTSFARCWNLKKAIWDNGKSSASGLSLPNINTPLGQNVPDGGKPRETPTP